MVVFMKPTWKTGLARSMCPKWPGHSVWLPAKKYNINQGCSLSKSKKVLYVAKQNMRIFRNSSSLTLCSRVVNLIKYPLMPGRFKYFECSTPKCTVTYILTL
jgi:hypothetical protein